MGNQQSAVPRERHKSGSQDLIPGSPMRGNLRKISKSFLETFKTQFHRMPFDV